MASYKVQVATGNYLLGGTFSRISITLVGTQGESPKQELNNSGRDFVRGAVDEFSLPCEPDLGSLLMIRLHKDPYLFFPSDGWYCSYVKVKTPQGDVYTFPSYQWLEGHGTWSLREGTAKKIADDVGNQLLLDHRKEELKKQQDFYRWEEYAPGWPRCHNVESLDTLDANSKYLTSMTAVFTGRTAKSELEVRLKGFSGLRDSWKSLEDIHKIFWFNKTPVSEYVAEHWLEDSFFGYQYLNGVHPTMIRKCTEIPPNFPVTPEMVAGCLGPSTSLQKELKKGNIFIIDYKILEGIPTCKLDGIQQYLAAPICLFYLNPKGQMMPLAIQLSQTPGPESPIFLPTDRKWDWTLAKIWTKLANFHVHEVNTHLLEAHFLGEVYVMATLRQLPRCHPIYKLLIPHTRFIFHINTLARTSLLHPGGFLDKAASTGREGMVQLMAKGTQTTTYASLCLPDDLQQRGVTSIPNYYYMEDGMKIWTAIENFVSAIVGFYYKCDAEVKDDPEIQAWVHEIFTEAFLGRESSGAPSTLETKAELTKFLTMIIFCSSARHAAVNSGQFDFAAWMPNTPATLRQPPPKVKGTASLESILDTLPDVSSTCTLLVVLSVVSYPLHEQGRLGHYPDEHFTEEEPKRHIAAFQERLAVISKTIEERNKKLALPYSYLNPVLVENSIAV
uniref:Hydroperoxide isomerase ALOXE3-like n=1 Tax=Pogona vitticeps TaxID=103695 RepID=A0ABM5EJA5_9SAUR